MKRILVHYRRGKDTKTLASQLYEGVPPEEALWALERQGAWLVAAGWRLERRRVVAVELLPIDDEPKEVGDE